MSSNLLYGSRNILCAFDKKTCILYISIINALYIADILTYLLIRNENRLQFPKFTMFSNRALLTRSRQCDVNICDAVLVPSTTGVDRVDPRLVLLSHTYLQFIHLLKNFGAHTRYKIRAKIKIVSNSTDLHYTMYNIIFFVRWCVGVYSSMEYTNITTRAPRERMPPPRRIWSRS